MMAGAWLLACVVVGLFFVRTETLFVEIDRCGRSRVYIFGIQPVRDLFTPSRISAKREVRIGGTYEYFPRSPPSKLK